MVIHGDISKTNYDRKQNFTLVEGGSFEKLNMENKCKKKKNDYFYILKKNELLVFFDNT